MTPRVHILKCWPESFRAVVAGTKTYEVRKDDRGYMVGDYLRLDEYEPHQIPWEDSPGFWMQHSKEENYGTHYTDEEQWVRVTHKTPGGSWGLPPDVCVLGIEKCGAPARDGGA